MISRGGSSSNGGGVQSIPPASRNLVQSLKEIVNCPESEIYAMLQECNMDPNEAVNRLLSQDPFHEVKSKREKKKENKDTTEPRSRGASNTLNCVGRSETDRYAGRGGSTQFSSSESGALYSKPAYKKENGTNNYISPLSVAFGMAGNNMNRLPPVQSDPVTTENTAMMGTVDGTLSTSQPSSGSQPAWSGIPGQVSMADIVKMGRSHVKACNSTNPYHYGVDQHHVQASQSDVSHQESRSFEYQVSQVSELNPEPVVGTGHHVTPDDDWPLDERPPAASVPPVLELPMASDLHVDATNLSSNYHHPEAPEDEVRSAEDAAIENINAKHTGSASAASSKRRENNSRDDFLFSNGIHTDMDSSRSHHSGFGESLENAGASVSSVISNLQQLSLRTDRGTSAEEDNPSVIIPNHLQVQAAGCSHLSFGSFGSGISTAFSRSFSSRPLQSNMEDTSADASSIGNLDTRNPEYYGDDSLRNALDANFVHRTDASARSYDLPSSSQPKLLKQENTEARHDNQYTFPSSRSDYNSEHDQLLNAAFPHSQASSQMQTPAPFSSVMAYTNSLHSSLLAERGQPVRESDFPYSPFPMTQTMPAKYSNAVSSISSSTISIPEALKAVAFSSTQPTAQTLPESSIATGLVPPQHLAVHPYSQPTDPLGPFANMIGYPLLPQNYTYMPSAFQQAFAGNSTYHQSLAAVLPQYKNNVSVSSLPQDAAIASGYGGGFGSSRSIPGNFSMNPPAASGVTSIGFDGVTSSQYKDSNHLISLQQNENSPMWVHGPGSRTMSAVPANTYYSFQGQGHQPQQQQMPSPSGWRQTQPPSQNFGALRYQDFHHSQTGTSLEHQQQNPRDGHHLGASQGQPSKNSQQMWQNNY